MATSPEKPRFQLGEIPRPLLWIGAPLTALVLIVAFLLLTFPWSRVQHHISGYLSQLAGARIEIEKLGPAFSLAGPGLALHDVRATWANGTSLTLNRVALRLAWSLAWLSGAPSLHLNLDSPQGHASGTLILGEEMGWNGNFHDLDLAQFPLESALSGASLEGLINAEVDLRLRHEGPEGPVVFDARSGSLALPGLPIALPYDELQGQIRFGRDTFLIIERVNLEGPMLAAVLRGQISRAAQLESAPLDLTLELEIREAALNPLLNDAGISVGPDGRSLLHGSGTLSHPQVR